MDESTIAWNLWLFQWINAPADPASIPLQLALFFAEFGPWLAIALLLWFWFRGQAETRRTLLQAGIALLIALSINFSFALTLYVPRPFAVGLGNNFLAHALETSFPSDHGTFLWSLGFGILFTRRLTLTALAIVVIGLLTAWARIYLGVHFPLDMLGSLLISLFAAMLALPIGRRLVPWLSGYIEPIQQGIFGHKRPRRGNGT